MPYSVKWGYLSTRGASVRKDCGGTLNLLHRVSNKMLNPENFYLKYLITFNILLSKCKSMRYLITTALLSCLIQGANADTASVNGSTIDFFLSGKKNSRTVVYLPGCNGKDQIGILYQNFHLEKIKTQFNDDVNVVMVQLFDDITKGAKDGVCSFEVKKINEVGANSFVLAKKVGTIIPWLKEQPWFNGTAHFFGFSQGGRVGLIVNSSEETKGFFKTVNLIWPMCLERYKFPKKLTAHTPTRVYATEDDPLSQPKNCPNLYSPDSPIELKLFPGNVHSWATHPSITTHSAYWPNYNLSVTHSYVKSYAEEMWTSWASWARCMETNTHCR